MTHDRIKIHMTPMQVKNLRSILQKLERSPRLQTLLGVTYDELLAATDALE